LIRRPPHAEPEPIPAPDVTSANATAISKPVPAKSRPRPPADAEAALRSRYDLRVLRSIRRIIRCVDLNSKQLESTRHITAPQLVCLRALVHARQMSAKHLAGEIHVSPSTLVGILDRLEEKGLVERERSRHDRRVVWARPTEKGAQLAEQTPSPLQDRLSEGLGQLPELEQAAIALALERVCELMEAQHIDSAPILETGPIAKP
jgi:DNA-binding MarR family transcriptional regulator